MFDIPVFIQQETNHKTASAPLLCWDIANLDLERRTHIHNDIEQLEKLKLLHEWQLDINYKLFLTDNHALVVTNISKEIIWASRSFQTMTDYEMDEIVGKNPSFLQGARTNKHTKRFIHERLANFETIEARILNYRKGGEPYWCGIRIFPIYNKLKMVTHYIAIEKEVN